MGDFKSCSLHGKQFPHNLIDLDTHEVAQLFIEQTQTIEGQKKKLSLFIGRSDNEGMDMCMACMKEKILAILESMGIPFSWKVITYSNEEVQKRDGSGTYKKLVKTIKTPDEIALEIKEAKKKAGN